ncbi:hypothetical protein BJ508DRAFT_314673 [Ascobolus immersus RN42]|uniref:Uncharacterized protein n=1 Tax=Ascobolus immersus RN42 TaxID=1160509 RepID=A0A3N4HK57_ASCIM|nr:hypothetical protein BJ508DRAFT_314673 [Ascobolus immersus RN42]
MRYVAKKELLAQMIRETQPRFAHDYNRLRRYRKVESIGFVHATYDDAARRKNCSRKWYEKPGQTCLVHDHEEKTQCLANRILKSTFFCIAKSIPQSRTRRNALSQIRENQFYLVDGRTKKLEQRIDRAT